MPFFTGYLPALNFEETFYGNTICLSEKGTLT